MKDERHIATELLHDLADKVSYVAAQNYGLDEDEAEELGTTIANYLAEDWGGQILYIPMNKLGRIDARNKQIAKEFNGENTQELSHKFNLSRQTIYRIIKAERSFANPPAPPPPRQEAEEIVRR